MSGVTIIPATAVHVRALGHSMREADEREITCLGLVAHRVLFRSYRYSIIRKTAIVDGEVAAMFGASGVLFGRVGQPWFLTGPASEKVDPIEFARLYRKEVRQMLHLFPILENWVDASYDKAVRLLTIAGFEMGEPKPFGPNNALFRKYRMSR
jgi:hypothetical protein